MRWKFAKFSLVVLVVTHLAGHAEAQQKSNSAFSLIPIDKLVEQIREFVTYIVDVHNKNKQIQQADSVGKLVSDLSCLSGMEAALAYQIDAIVANPDGARGGGPVMDALNYSLDQIKVQFSVIQQDIDDIDKQWAAKHASFNVDIGNFAHDGALYYCIVSCRRPYYTGGPAIILTEPKEAKQLSQALRRDVMEIKKISNQLEKFKTPSPK